ncbi:5-dehydro-4-deoxy-D-glucuronate isomerase [Thetidibacter halocola]|uniref:4-deoxy-L-threo-5-hexosulose-uronate ketol-isomerase n=1 Tax=Thetidibacter halocola TaxID=2827239 RepID=A0A8J7WCU6_9RHOB|nr:5-dehydro-4-deoxy-D-glucuronate isomerase [Thetidibacter halocola]MBS0124109.1 5-dehydro-4-deoxy-D-glucuronate isomerase [Thetidibacter halocola]
MIKTELRRAVDPRHARTMDTDALRAEFLVEDLFTPDAVRLVYSQYDRMIFGGAVPAGGPLTIDAVPETGTPSWLDRREAVLVNLGTDGAVAAGGETYTLGRCDMLYLGMGSGPVTVSGAGARFYIVSAPAHRMIPARRVTLDEAARLPLGHRDTANERVVNQMIHPAVMETCQIVMGLTRLATGSVWNTMPTHTHERRSEAYLYLDIPEDQFILHLMGEPDQTRHLVVRNEQAVLSPPWSIHCGAGTASYAFIWAMAGDNVDYTDMDMVAMGDLK